MAVILALYGALSPARAGGTPEAPLDWTGICIGMVGGLAQENLISLQAGIPIIFGANVGTCATAVLAGIGASREAKRVALAIDLARAEMSRMARLLGRMLDAVIVPFLSDERHIGDPRMSPEERRMFIREIPRQDAYHPNLTLMEGLDLREEKIDFLQKRISAYLARIAQGNITGNQAREVFGMVSIVKDIESMGDIIHRNMIPLIAKKRRLQFDFSLEGKEELLIYHGKVSKQVRLLQAGLREPNTRLALKIMKKERKYLDLESVYRARHLERIILKNENTLGTTDVHLELMDLMKQIVLYSANIAQTYVNTTSPAEGDHLAVAEKPE